MFDKDKQKEKQSEEQKRKDEALKKQHSAKASTEKRSGHDVKSPNRDI